MTGNTAPDSTPIPIRPSLPRTLANRSIVLVGLMGAGKTSIGRRLALRLNLPFHDADTEIEQAAGCTIAELFERYGEAAFRDGEKRVIRRLLNGPPLVLATGGGAFVDPETRAAIRARAVSIWLRCPLPVLLRRVSGRTHRPLLQQGNPAETLEQLMKQRHPIYAEADMTIDCGDDSQDVTTGRVMDTIAAWQPPQCVPVPLATGGYDVVVGPGLLAQAGRLIAPHIPQRRAVIVTDSVVASLHLPALLRGLEETSITAQHITVPPGEASKSIESWAGVVDALLAHGVERRTAVLALGGGVVGDLAGFAAAATLRGLPFVQIPTTLLAQVDSSVGGKTGVNTARGKNLVGAFHQPRIVLADTDTLATLPVRELRAGYAEIVKAGLIGDADFYAWCEANGTAVVNGDAERQAEAVLRACAFKAAVVGDDEREEKPNDGRALLNLGHTFAHALEAETGYGGALLHGEAVAIGIGLAFGLSARLGLCDAAEAEQVVAHIASTGLPARLHELNRRFSAAALVRHMRRDKKMQDGRLKFVLVRGIGRAFTSSDVAEEAVVEVLRAEGCG
ncbi:MAG TPA: 3-dehydroquinate synthase [Acetobacteraceae bacterium]|nr:3-dehydroquinate synthase [Acetobacteraceae bacterium]